MPPSWHRASTNPRFASRAQGEKIGGVREYVHVRASNVLDQEELVEFLESRFPKLTKRIGKPIDIDDDFKCVEVRVRSDSLAFEAIRSFIDARRRRGLHGFKDFSIGWYVREYTKKELGSAEVLELQVRSRFDPCGEECGTRYETLCDECNWGRQSSDLRVRTRRLPPKDISQSIARIEWVVSSRFVRVFVENGFSGAEFLPVLDGRKATAPSRDWHQLRIKGRAGDLAQPTTLGCDPFSPGRASWSCPRGHAVATDFLSELYLDRDAWDGSDIAVTTGLFGQGGNLRRPAPLILVSGRLYRTFVGAGLTGAMFEVAHLA
jgi:hypothetical protein